jgi:Anti-sigma-K factor rskA
MSALLPASSDGHPELAVAWVLHGLEPEEDAAFAEHLGDCVGCRRIVEETEDVTTLLGSAVEPAGPPPGLRMRILAAAEAESAPQDAGEALSACSPEVLSLDARNSTSSPAAASPAPPDDATVLPMRRPRAPEDDRRRWVRRATAGLAVAAALALVVAIGGLVASNRSLTEQRDAATAAAAQKDQVVQIMNAASQPGTPHAVLATPQGGFAGLVVDRGQGPEVLASGLTPNDSDHTYVLWGLAGKTPVGLTTFEMSGSGPVVRSVPSMEASGPFAGFAVSLEPGHAVPATPTQVVASGQTAG